MYGDVNVAVITGQRGSGYIKTHLRLKRGDEIRNVMHYWYREWPDHGVPENYTNVLELLRIVREQR